MIEHNGTTYEHDNRGKYRCPARCGHPDYPQPSWTTDKGFLKHLTECKGDRTWTPEPVAARVKFADCPDCGRTIWKMESCWRFLDRMVCLDCWEAYPEGYMDCAGLELPIFAVDS